MSGYAQIAKDLGTTLDVVAESAVEWQRQGYSIQETNDLIYASSALSVIGAMNSADATQALTASLNGYNMAASEAMNVVDQLTTLDLYYATKFLVGYIEICIIIYPINCGELLRE